MIGSNENTQVLMAAKAPEKKPFQLPPKPSVVINVPVRSKPKSILPRPPEKEKAQKQVEEETEVEKEIEEELEREAAKEVPKAPDTTAKPAKVDKPAGRPFDNVEPVNQDKLPNTKELDERKLADENDFPDLAELTRVIMEGNIDTPSAHRKRRTDELIAERILQGEIVLKAHEVVELAPSVKRCLARKLKNRNVKPRTAKVQKRKGAEMTIGETAKPVTLEVEEIDYFNVEDMSSYTYEVLTEGKYAGAVRHRDPVEQFLKDRPKEDKEKPFIMAARLSEALRVTVPTIEDKFQKECIMDSGSQIISMNFDVAMKMNLDYDPTIKIHMQSANGDLNATAGLAEDVHFTFGTFHVYLQVHLIRDTPYDVLIGRPFDVLFGTQIHNNFEGGQIITLRDRHSGKQRVIPTFERHKSPVGKDFKPDVVEIPTPLPDQQQSEPPSKPEQRGPEETEEPNKPREQNEAVNFQGTSMIS